jgi:serine/threonine protein kinase
MQTLQHPNIIRLVEVIEHERQLFLVMELAECGNLHMFVKNRGTLSEAESQRLFKELASAVSHCHEHGIIHGDIKHRNILLDAQLHIKLIDFGLSRHTNALEAPSFCGTPPYACPELLLGKPHLGPEVDVWSMGVVLYCMVVGQFPFDSVKDIVTASYFPVQGCSDAFRELISHMFQLSASARYQLPQILNHAWMQSSRLSTVPAQLPPQNRGATSSSALTCSPLATSLPGSPLPPFGVNLLDP